MIRGLLPRLAQLRDDALGTAGAALDRAIVTTALDLARRAPDREHVARDDHRARLDELAAVTEAYGDPRLITESERLFVRPAPIAPTQEPVRVLPRGRGAVIDLSWPSAFEPHHIAARERYLSALENRTARARVWLHPTPRPAIVCVHGYLGGHLGFEETAFSAEWLHGLGIDVAIAILPFHGARAPNGRRGSFPGRDPWRTVEGLAQSVFDLRALSAWLRARGATDVTAFGMSLGGYVTALTATTSDAFDHAVMMIPLASLSDVYFEHREGRDEAPPEWLRPRIDAAWRAVSPLSRPPRIDATAALVLAANGDRITRVSHAERLRSHFDCSLDLFAGGHILQAGRGRAFGSLARFLSGRGVISARR